MSTEGCTPYERLKGKRYLGDMYEFGSVVHVKFRGKPVGGVMAARWVVGVWFGKRWSTDEHVVVLPSGLVARVREVRPETSNRAFDPELFNNIIGLPTRAAAAP